MRRRLEEEGLDEVNDLPAAAHVPEICTDGFPPCRNAIRDAFAGRAHHGVIVKTYSRNQPCDKGRRAPTKVRPK
jgi:hypothetical protein